MRTAITLGATGLTVTYRWPAGMTPPPLLATTELVFWVALARIATRHPVRPTRVTAPQPPANPDTAAAYFGVPLREGPDWSIGFTTEDAARPFLTENEPMWRFFAPELRKRLTDLRAAASTAERVRAALLETLPAGDHTMTTIARHLATSPRTLQRQLQLEATSFQAVLAGTREHLARHYLTHSAMWSAPSFSDWRSTRIIQRESEGTCLRNVGSSPPNSRTRRSRWSSWPPARSRKSREN